MSQESGSGDLHYLRVLASSSGRAVIGSLAVGLVGLFIAGAYGGLIGAIIGGAAAAMWR